ncbi:MAG TPA: zf-HC2 domain-containing protein [Candidatus Sulfopaludibacter sp.]|jgi:anti-sigma factor RsiW|nr:zf-HC2 domain-containing protein [Candidatus Sulfopaludibacter sp.]
MHAVVMESLEDYLAGSLEPSEAKMIEAHLSNCDRCREEIHSMQEASSMFGSLQTDESLEASPAFFAGIMRKAEEARPAAPSFATFFDVAFGRRLVFASLLTLAITGGYLVTHEAESSAPYSPASIMAQQNAPGFDSASAPDNMLVTLTAYER